MSIKTPLDDATVDALIADLRTRLAAMIDPLDIPRSWTQRQLNVYEERRQRLGHVLNGLRNATVSSTDHLVATRDQMLGYKATLEQMILDAPDLNARQYNSNVERMRDKEWERQQGLAHSLKALQDGVKMWPNGNPAIPQPLADWMKTTCPHCHHTPPIVWPGSIPDIEADIALVEKRRKDELFMLNSWKASAVALLNEPAPASESASVHESANEPAATKSAANSV